MLLSRRERIILISMHVASLVCLSMEARCQEAQVFPTIKGGCSLSWLHKQAFCFSASSTSSLTPGSPGLPSRVLTIEGKGLEGSARGCGLLLDGTEELLRPYRICKSCGSTWGSIRSIAICFLLRLSTLVCVVTIAQENHSANKYGTLGFLFSSF